MTKKKRPEFSASIKRKVIGRSGNRCERCGIDFDDTFKGEFYHIRLVVYDGDKSFENCSHLCSECHRAAPNVKSEEDLLIYKYYFLRFASFKEAAKYYGVGNRFDLHVKIAMDIARNYRK